MLSRAGLFFCAAEIPLVARVVRAVIISPRDITVSKEDYLKAIFEPRAKAKP